MKLVTESQIQSQIKQYLELHGYIVYRINNTGQWNATRSCYIFHGTKGFCDLVAVNKQKDKILFIEVKKKPNKPTADQLKFLDMVDGIHSVNGIVAYGIDDLIKKI